MTLVYTLGGAGAVAVLVAHFWIVKIALDKDLALGMGSLLVPPVAWFFAATHWEQTATAAKLGLAGLALGGIAFLKLEKLEETPTPDGEWITNSGKLTVEITVKNRRIRFPNDNIEGKYHSVAGEVYLIDDVPGYTTFKYDKINDRLLLKKTGMGPKGPWVQDHLMYRPTDTNLTAVAKTAEVLPPPALPKPARRPPILDGPKIDDVQPQEVKPGECLTIRGSGFGPTINDSRVFLSSKKEFLGRGMEVTPSTIAEDEIRIMIPPHTSQHIRYMQVRGRGKSNIAAISIVRPHIASIMPTNAVPGSNLTIGFQGKYTHFNQRTTKITMGTSVAVKSIRVESPTVLYATVDVHKVAPLGLRSVDVQTDGERASYYQGFLIDMDEGPVVDRIEVVGPGWVTTLDGKSREKLSRVGLRIHGRNFRPNLVDTRVYYGGRQFVLSDATTTDILVRIPSDFTEGDVKVKVGGRWSEPTYVNTSGPRVARPSRPRPKEPGVIRVKASSSPDLATTDTQAANVDVWIKKDDISVKQTPTGPLLVAALHNTGTETLPVVTVNFLEGSTGLGAGKIATVVYKNLKPDVPGYAGTKWKKGAGIYQVSVVVDPMNAIQETDEGNNTASSLITVK